MFINEFIKIQYYEVSYKLCLIFNSKILNQEKTLIPAI